MSVEVADTSYRITRFDAQGRAITAASISPASPCTVYAYDAKNTFKGIRYEGCGLDEEGGRRKGEGRRRITGKQKR
jgi:hypothetical protein